MRLSDAIMLGAATCKMEPRNINSCAFGAALNALGIPPDENPLHDGTPRYFAIERIWPWTVNGKLWNEEAVNIVRQFDFVVCDGKMTLEQLVDYVRSVEPACECNRFDCDCATKKVEEVQAEYVTTT